MDNESRELNIILIIILFFVLFFSYCAIPNHEPQKPVRKVSQKARTQRIKEGNTVKAEQQDEAESGKTGEALSGSPPEPAEEPAQKLAKQQAAVTAPSESKTVQTPGQASGKADDQGVIAMNNPAYEKHTKSIVLFTHKKHVEEYAGTCGDCHHDETGSPLELSEGDSVQPCIACHSGTQKAKGEQLDEAEKIAKYHFEAIHANCVGCHKTSNIDKGDPKGKGPAPVSCTKCHLKK